MEGQVITKEEAQKSILAAYDSVKLINDLKAKESLTEQESDSLKRNVEHIGIMLGKDWFASELTAEQKSELEAIVK